MTAKELFLEKYSGVPLNQDTVIEMMEEYAKIHMIDEIRNGTETDNKYFAITRLDVINHTGGREYVKYHNFQEVNVQTQDGARTMKIFLK